MSKPKPTVTELQALKVDAISALKRINLEVQRMTYQLETATSQEKTVIRGNLRAAHLAKARANDQIDRISADIHAGICKIIRKKFAKREVARMAASDAQGEAA